jgi:hypothetical protein
VVERTRLIVAVPALLALCWLSFSALRAGKADAIVYDASVEMNTWSASGAQPGEQTINWVDEDLQRAARWTPGNAYIYELLGLLSAHRANSPDSHAHSLAAFRRALELRPTSPYDWANVIDISYRNGDTGALFEHAIARATQLGPNEPAVQRTVVDYGLAVWDEVAPATREAVGTMVANGMRRNPKEMLQIGERRGRLAIACRQLPAEPRTLDSKWSQLCQGTEATS